MEFDLSIYKDIRPRPTKKLKSLGSGLTLRCPLFIGDFSLDNKRQYTEGKGNMKLIDTDVLHKKIYFDLNKSIDKVRRKDEEEAKNEKLSRLLQWILLNREKFLTEETKQKGFQSLSTDIICFRGLLTELMCTPYEHRNGWTIYATKFRGTIYLLNVETPEREQQRLSQTEMDRTMCSWGFKFEQYMIGEDTTKGVDENEEYCCLLRSRLLSHSLVYGAEVDGADPKLYKSPHSSLEAFIELKTCKHLVTQRDFNNFKRFRLRKWWAQSYLAGIPHLICGFRTPEGIVNSLKSYMIEEIPKLAEGFWSKDVMLNFLNDFLSWVKEVVREDDPNHVYKFSRLPGASKITVRSLGPNSKESFLPSSYVNEIFK